MDAYLGILMVVYAILGFILYHKLFIVWYTDLAGGLGREILGCLFFAFVMSVLTFHFWKVVAIILAVIGIIAFLNKKRTVAIGIFVCMFFVLMGGRKYSQIPEEQETAEVQVQNDANIEESVQNGEVNKQEDVNVEEDQPDNVLPTGQFEKEGDNQTVDKTSEYILSYSADSYLTKEDLTNLSKEECRLARNEIYARHGRMFNDTNLQAYFDQCSWYQGIIEADQFDDSVLNDYEKSNLQLISEYEKTAYDM